MARLHKTVGYHVEVTADIWLHPERGTDYERVACDEIAAAIRRHVDAVSSVTVDDETEDVCEFCGEPWTELASAPHNGGCCDQDCEIMDAHEGKIA